MMFLTRPVDGTDIQFFFRNRKADTTVTFISLCIQDECWFLKLNCGFVDVVYTCKKNLN